jgi:hypothetical protein
LSDINEPPEAALDEILNFDTRQSKYAKPHSSKKFQPHSQVLSAGQYQIPTKYPILPTPDFKNQLLKV